MADFSLAIPVVMQHEGKAGTLRGDSGGGDAARAICFCCGHVIKPTRGDIVERPTGIRQILQEIFLLPRFRTMPWKEAEFK